MRFASRIVLATLVTGFAFRSVSVEAAPPPAKVMVLTSTYGVMAGALTGLASLAFYKSPGNHMRNVALGASLGLYTGIALGLYLVYFDPGKKKNEPAPEQTSPDGEEQPQVDKGAFQGDGHSDKVATSKLRPWQISERNLSAAPVWAPIIGLNKDAKPVLGAQLYF